MSIDPPAAELIKEWIHFKYFLSDRINRMDWILSQFPDETVKRKYPIIHVNSV
jgi:signal transduction histidine kinase